jgi:hypothetical protein
VLGVLSVALLAACFVWAHHWGALTDTLVAGWALATLASLVVSIQFLRDKTVWSTYGSHRLARIGLAGGVISVVALVVAGIASAAGVDVAGACGGG